MRAIWKGNISFALVTIPISLYSATKREEDISLNYIHKKDLSKVSYRRFCEAEGVEVPWEEIARGFEYEKGQYVEISDEELDKADVEMTKTIQILEFVKEEEIDPIYFDKPYYLEPQKGGERAYALMREALAQSKRVGIARVVLKSREHLAAVKPVGSMISLQMMRFAQEIVDAEELKLPTKIEVSEKEMGLANMLIDSMSGAFEPAKYRDEYHDKVLALIQAKVAGVAPQAAAPAAAKTPGKIIDLMEVLKESLKTAKKPAGITAVEIEEPVAAGDGGGRSRSRKGR